MLSWVIMYLFVYLLFSIWPVADDIRNESEPLWSSIAELFSDACLILSALCYWLPSINHILFGYSETAYMTGLGILIGQTGRALWRNVRQDDELSFIEKLTVGTSATLLIVITTAPLLFWGFMATVLGACHDC
ncbi:MAG: hypothetical protein MUE46_14955 [Xanthomonadales bacterium]|jgi:hypothetical protein|nr:hypothetical protein [Xanthomonadales bacterium]